MVSKVDFTPNVGIKQRISVSQYDVGRTITVNLFDGYEPYVPPTGATAVIHGTKPSGLGFTVAGTLDGSVASFTTTAEMTAESGYMDAEIQITASGAVIGMANVMFYVEKSPHPTGTVDGTAEDVVNRIGTALNVAMDDIEDAKDDAIAEIQVLVIANASQVAYNGTTSGISATNVQGAIDEVKEDLSTKTGLSDEAKQALLACFAKVAWIDEHGQDYYDALEEALYPPATLVRISAVYTQSGTVYDTDSLDSFEPDLVVTAHYSDGTSGIVTGYTLSGTLEVGTSTITVSYGGLSTAFTVAVTATPPALYPLPNGTFTSATGVISCTISNGKHVRIDVSSNVTNQFVNAKSQTIGSATVINGLPEWFEVASGATGVLAITNIINPSNLSFAANFRKSGSAASASFGIEPGSHTTDVSMSSTLSSAESLSCLFVFLSASAGSYLEFDFDFKVDGTDYI